MLIGRVDFTDTGIRIVDVDGSIVEMSAKDALKLQHEMRLPDNYQKLVDAMWRADRKEHQRRKDTVG
jgi:uncharacterized cupredoxin-like copper-binding protein